MRIECRRIALAMVVLTVWAGIGRSEEPTARISGTDGQVISKERADATSPNLAASPTGQTPLIRPVASELNLATARWDRDTVREAARAGRKLTVKAFPLPNDRSVDLELKPFSISSSNSRFVVGRKGQPDRPADFDPTSISFFRGEVAGRPGSHVFLALGDLFSAGYVDLGAGAGRFEISSLGRDGQPLTDGGLSVFQGAASSNLPPGVELCGVDSHRHKLTEAALGLRVQEAQVAAAPPSNVGLKHMELAVDSDYEYFALIGEETAAIAYLHVVYGAVSDFFMRDVNVHIEVVFTRVWTDPDDLFNGSDPLTEFWMEWEANMGAVSRDAAQLFSGRRDYQFGGAAFLSQLCNFGYGAIGYAVGFLPDPSKPSPFNWDAMVTAHELGHTFGAPHTHDLGLDTCDDGNTTPQRGSIMSYCGQTWSGMNANTDNYFHTTIRGEIFNHVSVSACVVPDCNMNNVDDAIDIAGASPDVNSNGIPDECEDCNENGTLDPADIAGASFDVNSNGIPDECEADCDNDGIPDDWEIALGALDLYGNGLPDSCETDCNNNSVSDYTEIQANMPFDVDRTATLDSCQNCDGDSLTDHEELEGSHYLWVASGLSNSPVRQFFPSTGVLTTSSPVDTADTMDSGQDVLATSDGRVLVSSANDDRVLAFDSDGSFLGGLVSSGAGGLDYPTGMIMTAAGKLYVASRNTNSVLIFNGTTGASEGVLISSGLGGLAGPFGMTFGPNGNLFVTSSTNEVFEYDVDGAMMVGKFVDAADNGTLDQPRGLTFKADGNLLVASYGSDEVLEFDGTTGVPMGKWAKVGTATAITQDSPWGVRVGPNGHVFVTRTGTPFSSSPASDGGDVEHSHLTDARMFEFHVCTGNFRRTLIGGNDHGLDFATGFDFVPGFTIDCNNNQIQDSCDINSGESLDTNSDDIPDECQVDCNGNGTFDGLDLIPFGTSVDCNCNFTPDECDIASGGSLDCNNNGVPDECEDCDGDGLADSCDIAGGTPDCNENGIPDDCESPKDCNHNGSPDICDIFEGEPDCDGNTFPDSCDVDGGGLAFQVDFESGLPTGWTTTGFFQVTGACAVNPVCDGSQWAYAGNTAGCGYPNQETAELISPSITLAETTIELAFCSMIDSEEGFDFGKVYVNDTLVFQDSGEDHAFWQEHVIDLTAFGGQTVVLTFRFASDCLFEFGKGWQVDNIRLTMGSPDCDENGTPDECDPDANENGIPDGCEIPAPLPDPNDGPKNRFISFIVPTGSAAASGSSAMRSTTSSTARFVTGPVEHLRQVVAAGVPTAEIRLTPMAEHPAGAYNTGGYYGNSNISGQTLSVPSGGGRTYWNWQITNWGPSGSELRAWQGRVDAQGFLGANADCGIGPGSCPVAGDLAPAAQACSTHAQCVSAFGEAATICLGGTCRAAFVNQDRGDWVHSNAALAVNTGCILNDFTGPFCFGVADFSEPRPDDAGDGFVYYGATIVIDVPSSAEGQYILSWEATETRLADEFFESIPLALMVPGVLAAPAPVALPGTTAIRIELTTLNHICSAGSDNLYSPCTSDSDCIDGFCEARFAESEGQFRYVNSVRTCQGLSATGRTTCRGPQDCVEDEECLQLRTCQGVLEQGGFACSTQAHCDAHMSIGPNPEPLGGTCQPSMLCSDDDFKPPYLCATTGCEPEYRNWASDLAGGVLHVYGPGIVPGRSEYNVATLPAACAGSETDCALASTPLAISTARWCDVNGDGAANALDIARASDKVKPIPEAFFEPRMMLFPGIIDPVGRNVNVVELQNIVDGVKSLPITAAITGPEDCGG